jgi:LacI family transcriptional regulator
MPTIRDVARLANVAPITVSRVINKSGYISDETRVRVEQAIAELEYVPNSLSRSLRFKKTDTIALLVSDITNPFWTAMTRGVEDVAGDAGFNVILCNTDESPDKQENYINVLLQKQVDGILVSPAEGSGQELVRRMKKREVPMVAIDRQVEGVHVDVVRSDSEGGAYRLVSYLIEIGHRDIAIINGPLSISTGLQRYEGYRRALLEHGITPDERLMGIAQFRPESGYKMMFDLLQRRERRPTAVFAANNFIALGAIRALRDMGLSVPDDISIVGFDELPHTFEVPFVTVIAQMPYEIGAKAAKLLADLITGIQTPDNRDIVVPVELIIRRSARALK